jgi:hypothetical protein
LVIVIAPFVAFYNLEANPRPWHDEGSYLSLAKTLVTDGVYAVRSSEGYQTFGAVQSAGPTVVLPVAVSFKLFGTGLVQARVVSAGYMLFALAMLFGVGFQLFGLRTALFAVIALLSSSTVGFLLYGRQVLGEVPALGYWLAGWIAWDRGVRAGRGWGWVVAGLLFGAAMVTKSQYVAIGGATILVTIVLDRLYYRQGAWKKTALVGVVAVACVGAWWAWQWLYFGSDTLRENADMLRRLAAATTGLHLDTAVQALQVIFGSSAPLYFFWAVPALLYCGILSLRRRPEGLSLAFLMLFAGLWLTYFIFWMIPWPHYALASLAVCAVFVGKLYDDLLDGLIRVAPAVWSEIRQSSVRHFASSTLSPTVLVSLGAAVALVTMGLLTGNQLQKVIRTDVLDKVGQETSSFRGVPQFDNPHQLASFMESAIPKGALVETWERELSILTDHRYHFPDQSLLAQSHAAFYRGAAGGYALGLSYFQAVRPAYVVMGWFARFTQIYDSDYLSQHGTLIGTVGHDKWGYEIYELR